MGLGRDGRRPCPSALAPREAAGADESPAAAGGFDSSAAEHAVGSGPGLGLRRRVRRLRRRPPAEMSHRRRRVAIPNRSARGRPRARRRRTSAARSSVSLLRKGCGRGSITGTTQPKADAKNRDAMREPVIPRRFTDARPASLRRAEPPRQPRSQRCCSGRPHGIALPSSVHLFDSPREPALERREPRAPPRDGRAKIASRALRWP
jgi:hypothetical protein